MQYICIHTKTLKNHKKHEFKIPLCLETNLVQKPQPKMVCVNFWRHPVKQPRRRSNFRVQWPLALLNQGPLKKWTEHSNCPLRGRGPSMYYVIKILCFLIPSPLPLQKIQWTQIYACSELYLNEPISVIHQKMFMFVQLKNEVRVLMFDISIVTWWCKLFKIKKGVYSKKKPHPSDPGCN